MRKAAAAFVALALAACGAPPAETSPDAAYAPQPYVRLTHPEWSKNAVLYELNTRQFTPEGTFRAAQAQLPRLKALGIDIIWLMPIHPIGVEHRKGSLGSPYSVRDYRAVNPEFGTLDDLKAFVSAAHAQGMHVILDWVANHTAWDNPLVRDHPDWYERDWKGDFHPTPWWDWSDIIDLNYDRPALRRTMTEAMVYWVREADVDGFRCDVAGYVPLDFWEHARRELEAIKPVFMLAEWEERDAHARAFDATYAWTWNNAMHDIAMGHADVGALFGYYSGNESAWPREAMRMTYVSNHDQNAWDATEFERFGPALDAAIVLSVVGEGVPLIYNGQEAGNPERLKFFEREPIRWREHPEGELYRRLIALKHANTALWNGQWGARMIPVVNSAPGDVLSFVRANDKDKVFAVFNLSPRPHRVAFAQSLHHGTYLEYFTNARADIGAASRLDLPPWSYRIYVRQSG
jgi:glycosidase